MPENPLGKNPVKLVNELRGQDNYHVVEEKGTSPTTIFVMAAEVDGNTFSGQGRNKKEAKRQCAMAIMAQLHNIVFPDMVKTP